jgi:hypothetical protein
MYCGYIIKVENLRAHPNADRLQILGVFGTETTVDLSVQVGDIGIYFPTDGQLSVEFAEVNNLVRKKDDAGNQIGGFLDPAKRNIRAINLRGEKSDGLYLPISALDYCYNKDEKAIDNFKVGDTISVVNGHDICCKYIPRSNKASSTSGGNKTRKKKVAVAPLFAEHADTEQLAYHLSAFKAGDEIEITLKMHGTSQRTGCLPVLQGYKRTFLDWLFRREGKPIYDYGYVSGTRRVVLENYEGGFYGNNEFREQHSKVFEGKLWKGETVYYEVVGFTTAGAPIMGDANNKKLNDKEFIKQYGETTRFSYGCSPNPMPALVYGPTGEVKAEAIPQSDIYVYRITMTNPDGEVVEYTPDFMRYRCEQMAVKTVPVFWKGVIEGKRIETGEITPGEWIKNIAEGFYDGPDPIGKTHVREGVVVRIVNRPKFTAYKHKNYSFKVLEGIVKDTAEAPDMEEAQEISEAE